MDKQQENIIFNFGYDKALEDILEFIDIVEPLCINEVELAGKLRVKINKMRIKT